MKTKNISIAPIDLLCECRRERERECVDGCVSVPNKVATNLLYIDVCGCCTIFTFDLRPPAAYLASPPAPRCSRWTPPVLLPHQEERDTQPLWLKVGGSRFYSILFVCLFVTMVKMIKVLLHFLSQVWFLPILTGGLSPKVARVLANFMCNTRKLGTTWTTSV